MIAEDEDAAASQEQWEPEVRFSYDPDRRECVCFDDEAELKH
jgi:hypothetical protein